MSLNIPNSLLRHASSVNIDVNIDSLGVRQRNTLNKMLITGVTHGEGVPSQIARYMLKETGRGFLHLGNYSWVSWTGVPLEDTHPVRAALIAASVAASLDTPKTYYRTEEEMLERCKEAANGHGHFGHGKIVLQNKDLSFNHPHDPASLTGTITIQL